VDSTCSLEFTSKANCCGVFDDGWFILDGLGCFDRSFHGINVVITIFDMLRVPSTVNESLRLPICFETFQNIFGESA
jgi:hypothetical protein